MNDDSLRKRDSTTARVSGVPSMSAALPADLLARATRRLGTAAIIYACVYALAYGSARLAQSFPQQWDPNTVVLSDTTAATFILLSVGMFLLSRSGRLDDCLLMNLGLIYEVVGAAGIEIGIVFLRQWPESAGMVGLSWTCVWIVIFPLLVPTTPGKTVLASIAAACMQPLMYSIAVARGLPPLPGNMLFMVTFPTFICVGLAMVGSRVVYGLGTDVHRARQMGSYRLTELLGTGGMGEVWKAEHRMLARSAAIKLIRSGGGESAPAHTPSSHLLRFEREAQATAQLRSPHTIQLYDFGITEDRTFYYVMELLEGLSLDELVSRYGALPPGRAIRILRQVCHSLAEAHGKNLVHRDIKPANIYVCRYGRDLDFVKVLDFGLVKMAGEELERNLGITRIGAYIGTPAYGSPELASGSPETDIRSDIYSLGCVAFWLLTGRTVFRAPTLPAMLVKHINDAPDPPSRYARFAVPPALDNLILDCLRKNKDERPASAEVLGRLLTTIQVDQPWTDDSAREWWDQYRPVEREGVVPVLPDSTQPLTVTKLSRSRPD